MAFVKDFKAFALKGNVVDLAVAVVIGGAFGKIVTAFVDGIVMPVIAMLTGGVNAADWKWVLKPAQLDAAGKQVAAEVAIRYGLVLQSALDFVLIALVIFLFLKLYNRLRDTEEAAAPPEEVLLLREIRDALRR